MHSSAAPEPHPLRGRFLLADRTRGSAAAAADGCAGHRRRHAQRRRNEEAARLPPDGYDACWQEGEQELEGVAHLDGDGARVVGRIDRSGDDDGVDRSEEHTSELQSLMRISYAVFCLQKIILSSYASSLIDITLSCNT